MTVSIADAAFLSDPALLAVLDALDRDGEEARIAGGAVRNTLMGLPVTDEDIATTALPDIVIERTEAAGLKAVKTGYEHGTITVVSGGRGFEVTTLRSDIDTDGRRATVHFGRDWKADAERRDFTINALYATRDGRVIDLIGGVGDIAARRLRFIGDAETRIREDYLRILRFFRFFAWYGDGRPDPDGLKACARLKEGLDRLSAERVWAETKKLLAAPDPARSLLWMRQSGVLSAILPETANWGIDSIHGLIAAGRDLGWPADPLLRLMAITPPDGERLAAMAKRLRLSKAESARLTVFADSPTPGASIPGVALDKLLYEYGREGVTDRLRLALAGARWTARESDKALADADGFARLLAHAEAWTHPVFPLRGADLLARGIRPGPQLGAEMARLGAKWADSGFSLDREALLAMISPD